MTKQTQYPIERPVTMTDEVAEAIKAVADKAELEGRTRRSVNAELLNKAVMLDITYHQWTARAKADRIDQNLLNKNSKAARLLNTTMKLIESDAYNTITTRTNEMRAWVLSRCMPSFIVAGIFFVKLEAVDEFEAKITEFNTWLDKEGVPDLVRDYERAKSQARQDFAQIARELGLSVDTLYKEAKYPTASELRGKFGVEHNWVTFGVPASLPAAIRAQESVKIQAKFEEAAEEISAALREGFAALIEHATERLTTRPGEKKVIKESLVDNFKEFCETFRLRNLTEDDDLEMLVKQAEQIMSATDARTLRERPRARGQVLAQLNTIKQAVDEMIVAAPRRKFDLDALDE